MNQIDSIAIELIEAKIEGLNHTISKYQGNENIGVRIAAQGKIIMLNELMKEIIKTYQRLK